MKKILILEDNALSREMLVKLLQGIYSDLQIYEAVGTSDAYKIAMENNIDLFLIDIILDSGCPGDVSGIIFVDRIRQLERYRFVPVIVTSALEDQKLIAYSNLHCYSYLEKPLDLEWVKRIVIEALAMPISKKESEYLYFRKDGILYSQKKSEIMYIRNFGRKTTIYSRNSELELPYKSCKQMLSELDSIRFLQCNRNDIVNRDYITYVDYANRYIALKEKGKILELGIVMRKKFMKELTGD